MLRTTKVGDKITSSADYHRFPFQDGGKQWLMGNPIFDQ